MQIDFKHEDPETLRMSIVSRLRGPSRFNDQLCGQASSMLSGLLGALCFLRDHEGIDLSGRTVMASCSLEKLGDFVQRSDLPAGAVDKINDYLLWLPGYIKEDAEASEINPAAYEHHHYLVQELAEIFSAPGDGGSDSNARI
ncbi:hypothetical protein [Marinobacter shengliensis]|uniref:hypothetical protein n=1 Tax=Marinobacter shengliensis TaxID=1389223 RepID=UPI001109FBD9|nr:hypothetical protein [Marinobacter shengliensis]